MFVYVMSRADGWHKIGLTVDVEYRRSLLNSYALPHQRPVNVVRSFELGHPASLIEKIAHHEAQRCGGGEPDCEWFNASATKCVAAVHRAIRIYEADGPSGWQAAREARNRLRRKATGHKPVTGKKGNRPKQFPPEVVDKARRVWESRKYKTYNECKAALPKGFSVMRAFRMFGGRS